MAIINKLDEYVDSSVIVHGDKKLDNILNTIFESKKINANENIEGGYYIKFSDGTMIECINFYITTSITNPWGTLFESPYLSFPNFPQKFIEVPFVSISIRNVAAFLQGIYGTTKDSLGGGYITRANSASGTNYYFTAIAVGRWK